MLKLLGSILIIGGCSGIGFYIASRGAARIRILRELEQILEYLYGEIEYSGCDMAELMERLSFRGGAFGDFFLGIRGKLLSHQGYRFSEYWSGELSYIHGVENLLPEDIELLHCIGDNLGNCDRGTQLRTIEIFKKRLEKTLAGATEEYRGKAKLSIIVCATAGCFLAILLL